MKLEKRQRGQMEMIEDENFGFKEPMAIKRLKVESPKIQLKAPPKNLSVDTPFPQDEDLDFNSGCSESEN